MLKATNQVLRTRDVKGKTLYKVLAAKTGPKRAREVLTFMVQWQMVLDAEEAEDITLQDFADWWNVPRTTAFRYQSWFRAAFPKFSTPTAVLAIIRTQWEVSQGVRGLSEAAFAPAA